MEPDKEYFAFISYKREDEKWAKWLQHKLEHYRFPTNLNERTDLPKNIRPTFRDITDLTPGVLAEEIDVALRNSQWLIVICSPRSARSPWVGKEAQTFIDHGRSEHIIPFVIEGNPFSKEPDAECYPEALLNLTGDCELLATNINEMGRDAAAIKVVARMFGLKFDTLWRRHEREQRRKRWLIVAGSILFALLSLAVGAYVARMNIQLDKANANLTAVNKEVQAERDRAKKATDSLIIVNKEVLAERDRANTERDRAEEVTNSLRTAYDSITRQNDLIQQQNVQLAEERDNVLRANWKMMENRARFVAEKGQELIVDHDSYTARLLALAILPESMDNPDKPYISEVEALLRDASYNDEGVLRGHTGRVSTVVFSPDGKRIVTGSDDKTIRIWDAATGRQIGEPLIGHTERITSVAFSYDNKRIVSGAFDGTIRIWDVITGKQIREIIVGNDYKGLITSVSFSPDGKSVVSGACDSTIRIWEVTTGIQIGNSLLGHTDAVNSVAFSPDGKRIVSGSWDNTVRIWDVTTGIQVGNSLVGHNGAVNFVSFSPDGVNVVSASMDETVCIWNAITGKRIRIIEGLHFGGSGHPMGIQSAEFSFDGNKIVSGVASNLVEIWDASTGWSLGLWRGHTDYVNSVMFSPDGRNIVSASNDHTARIWDITSSTYSLVGKPIQGG